MAVRNRGQPLRFIFQLTKLEHPRKPVGIFPAASHTTTTPPAESQCQQLQQTHPSRPASAHGERAAQRRSPASRSAHSRPQTRARAKSSRSLRPRAPSIPTPSSTAPSPRRTSRAGRRAWAPPSTNASQAWCSHSIVPMRESSATIGLAVASGSGKRADKLPTRSAAWLAYQLAHSRS